MWSWLHVQNLHWLLFKIPIFLMYPLIHFLLWSQLAGRPIWDIVLHTVWAERKNWCGLSRQLEKILYLQNLILVGGFTMCSLGLLQMWRSGTALAVVMVEFRVLREEYRAKQQAHLDLWRAVFCLCRDFFWKCPVGYVPGRRVQESCWFSRTSSSRLKIDP